MRRRDGPGHRGDASWPVQVVVAERGSPPAIVPERAGGGAYRSAWIFVLDEGRPIGKLEVDIRAGPIAQAEVARLIHDRLGAEEAPEARGASSGPFPFATVIVPTTGERLDDLRGCLEALSGMDYPEYEVLLVNNRPCAENAGVIERAIGSASRVRVLAEAVPGVSAAKNRGLAEARGEIVAFTDDDIVVDRRWLAELVQPISSDPAVGAVTGLVLPREVETSAQWWFEEYGGFGRGFERRIYQPVKTRSSRRPHEMVTCVRYMDGQGRELESLSPYSAAARCSTGGSLAVRADLLLALGGFDTSLGSGTRPGGGEDLAIFARLLLSGTSVHYEPSALSYHKHRRSYPELARQMRARGKGLTAMLTSLTCEDHRHARAIATEALPAFEHVVHRARRGSDVFGHPITFPPQLRWHEVSGMFLGPPAYLVERLGRRISRKGRP